MSNTPAPAYEGNQNMSNEKQWLVKIDQINGDYYIRIYSVVYARNEAEARRRAATGVTAHGEEDGADFEYEPAPDSNGEWVRGVYDRGGEVFYKIIRAVELTTEQAHTLADLGVW